jgi:hypothetical protein
MAEAAVRRDWVKRVLGVDLANPPGDTRALNGSVAAWRDALARADQQAAALQNVLRQTGDPDLQDIAEFGLNAMTANHRIKIQAALMEIERGQAPPPVVRKALDLTGSLRAHIAADARFAACDSNPFGVAISFRETLLPPLDALQNALKAALTT